MASPLKFVMSERGCPKLIDGPYLYNRDKAVEERTYWRCQYSVKFCCPARITTANGQIESKWKSHNHVETNAKVEAVKIRNEIKKRTLETIEPPQEILVTCLEKASSAAVIALPRMTHLKCNMQHQRSKLPNYPKLPHHREDLVLPLDLVQTKQEEHFVLFDSGVGDWDRVIIFGTQRNLIRLAGCEKWFADGTFKVVPHLFYQLYSIHSLHGNKTFPLIYCLLPNKSQNIYDKMLRALKELDTSLNPTTITMDFEMAAINSFETAFPQSSIHGCFFHFCQCLMREISSDSLKQLYESDDNFSLTLRMLAALAFVPPADVINSFENHG